MNLAVKAKARTGDIIVQNLDKEILVYDLKTHQAMSLNETASKVWSLLDGKTSVAEIARQSNIPAEIIFLSIDELQKRNLISGESDRIFSANRLTRRNLLIKATASAVALPIIVGLVVPKSAQAASCLGVEVGFQVGAIGSCSPDPCNTVCRSSTRCCSPFVGNYLSGTCQQTGITDITCGCICINP